LGVTLNPNKLNYTIGFLFRTALGTSFGHVDHASQIPS